MSESEERTGLESKSVPQSACGTEEEEPPGTPKRHPLWSDDEWLQALIKAVGKKAESENGMRALAKDNRGKLTRS